MTQEQLGRFAKLISLLHSQPDLTAAQLASQVGVCVRTVQRYIQLLKAAGTLMGQDAAGQGLPGARLAPLTQNHLVVLLWAARLSPVAAASPYGELIREATEIILARNSPHVRQKLSGLLKRTATVSRSPDEDRRFSQILEAMRRKKAMRVTIRDAQGLISTWLIPTGISLEAKHVIGHSSHHGCVCKLPLSQIEIVAH